MRFRWVHRWYARTFGYFWLPCPLCGRDFGGHEWRDIGGNISTIPTDEPGIVEGICPSCTIAGYGWDDGTWMTNPMRRD